MNIDWLEIKSQLAPGWSPVNIGITLLLFLFSWPLALLMLGYILKGRSIGLDLRSPSTYKPAFSTMIDRTRSLISSWTNNKGDSSFRSNQSDAGGTPAGGISPGRASRVEAAQSSDNFEQWRSEETAKLKKERADLERERMLLDAQKQAFKEQQKNTID